MADQTPDTSSTATVRINDVNIRRAKLYRLYDRDGLSIGFIVMPEHFTSADVNNLVQKGMKVTAVKE